MDPEREGNGAWAGAAEEGGEEAAAALPLRNGAGPGDGEAAPAAGAGDDLTFVGAGGGKKKSKKSKSKRGGGGGGGAEDAAAGGDGGAAEGEADGTPEAEAEAAAAPEPSGAPAAAAPEEPPAAEAPSPPAAAPPPQQDGGGGAPPPADAAGAARPPLVKPRSAGSMVNPLGASKGSLMSLGASVNPDAELVRCTDAQEEVRSSPLQLKQLKEQFLAGGGNTSGGGGGADGSALNTRSAGGASLTQHDLVNTANVAQMLQAGEFRLRPGADFVSYEALKELRLEDGLDVSRKEEYLADAEFEGIFGMDKRAFAGMPAWKRISVKKAKGLF